MWTIGASQSSDCVNTTCDWVLMKIAEWFIHIYINISLWMYLFTFGTIFLNWFSSLVIYFIHIIIIILIQMIRYLYKNTYNKILHIGTPSPLIDRSLPPPCQLNICIFVWLFFFFNISYKYFLIFNKYRKIGCHLMKLSWEGCVYIFPLFIF